MNAMSMTPESIAVNVQNFVRAETDAYFSRFVVLAGLGALQHRRTPTAIKDQDVVRMNRDTLYSAGVFDLGAGPVTITLPESKERFMSLQLIDEDHYTSAVIYDAGAHDVTKDLIGTRYVALILRMLVDPNDPDDVREVNLLQDAVRLEQGAVGSFEVPAWDTATLAAVRETLKYVAPAVPLGGERFGRRDQVDPMTHLIGTATGWGGNPSADAAYFPAFPKRNDGVTEHRLTVKDVPVDGFWSVSVYNRDGYFEENDENAYSVNNLTAVRDDDGSVTIQFGGDRTSARNHLPITPGWNYTARMYRPRQAILTGDWSFPEPQPVD
jgi:hypothetical protein